MGFSISFFLFSFFFSKKKRKNIFSSRKRKGKHFAITAKCELKNANWQMCQAKQSYKCDKWVKWNIAWQMCQAKQWKITQAKQWQINVGQQFLLVHSGSMMCNICAVLLHAPFSCVLLAAISAPLTFISFVQVPASVWNQDRRNPTRRGSPNCW